MCHGIGTHKSFPIGQMLSQMHDMEWLTHWVNSWKHLVQQHIPKKKNIVDECVVDESPALIGTVVSAFTQDKTTAQYIDRCMSVLLHKRGELPTCFVRIDRSHFVKSIHKNLKKGFAKTQRLLRGIMGYLIQCSNIKIFEEVILNIFTLIRSEYISPEVTKAKEYLTQLVRTHEATEGDWNSEETNTSVKNIDEQGIEQNESFNISSYKDTCSYRWVMSIYNSINMDSDEENENIYHSPASEKYLIHSFVRCPLWSNIMVHEFESKIDCATSGSVENEFKTIKNLMGYNKRRVDLFLENHLAYLSGKMKLGKADQNLQMLQRPRSNSMENITSSSVEEKKRRSSYDSSFVDSICNISAESPEKMPVEDWGGWQSKLTKTRRAVNSILNPHDPEYFYSDIILLSNGYESPKIYTENTCAFDSIYPIFCAAVLDYAEIKQQFMSYGVFSSFVQKILEKPKSLTKLYNFRNEILCRIFSSDEYEKNGNLKKPSSNQKLFINCFTGLASFFCKLNVPSYVEFDRCVSCGSIRKSSYPLIPLNNCIVQLDSIEGGILAHKTTTKCPQCGKTMTVTREFQYIIAFEVEPTTDKPKLWALESIQNTVTIEQEKFKLLGVISFSSNHFTSYILRKNRMWEVYDDLRQMDRKRISNTTNLKVNPFMLFYVKQ